MINKYSDVPLYCQLKKIIIEKIESGEYAPESKIPSEQELSEMYNISRPTVRQAISELTNSGYLYKEKGKGTFVSRAKVRIDIKNYTGFADSILDSQVPGEREIVDIKVVSSASEGALNEIFGQPGDRVLEFTKTTYVTKNRDDVIAVNTSYIPVALFPNIANDIREKKSSFEIMRGKYPLLPAKTRSSLEIINLGQELSQYLNVQPGQPVIKIESVFYSKSGQIVEYVISNYRADMCKLFFENAK